MTTRRLSESARQHLIDDGVCTAEELDRIESASPKRERNSHGDLNCDQLAPKLRIK